MQKVLVEQIRNQIEHTWPKWKIDWANCHLITSVHARKLVYRGDENTMRIGGIIKNDFSAAPGVCVTVFIQGCPLHCPGCHNPELQSFDGGRELDDEAMDTIYRALKANGIKRSLCVMGGEPLCEDNIFTTTELVLNVHMDMPNVPIYIWTGYTYEQLKKRFPEADKFTEGQDLRKWNLLDTLTAADYLIDGPFKQEERDVTLCMRGSRNQRIINLKTGKDVTDDFESRTGTSV